MVWTYRLHGEQTKSIDDTNAEATLNTENKKDGYNINLLKPTGHMMHQQFNIQQLYVLPTLYLCVLYLSENKQRIVPLTA